MMTEQCATDAEPFRQLHSGDFLRFRKALHDRPSNGVRQGGQYRHVLGIGRGLHTSSYRSWCSRASWKCQVSV
jgi:hypothetical protein